MSVEITYDYLYRIGCREPVALRNMKNGKIIVLNKKELNKPMVF